MSRGKASDTDRTDAGGPMRAAEKELLRLRLLVDRSRDMLLLHDVRGQLLECNAHAHDSLGYTREEFLRMSIGDVNSEVGAISPERLGENWRGMPLDSTVLVETHHRHRDGTQIPVEVLVAPFEHDGERLFVAIARDIRGRRSAEAARRQNELRFQAVFEGTPVGMVLLDGRGQIVAANSALAAMFGVAAEELIDQRFGHLLAAARIELEVEELEALSRGEREQLRIETCYLAKHGEWRWAELSAFRFGESVGGEPSRDARAVVFAQDISERKRVDAQRHEIMDRLDELVAQRTSALQEEITERRRTERELSKAIRAAEAANLAKSQFLASMSHELRTPLNAVIGYSEMLIEEADDSGSAELVPDLERICNAGKHLLGIINDILDLSKIEAGKIELYIEAVDLAAFLDEITATIQPLAATNNNTLRLSVDLRDDVLMTDITRLRQMLFNLLSNACKFTDSGQIELRVREAERAGEAWLCFAIHDSGVGIKPDQLEKLFQPFTQADASTSRRYGGTGLGLSITKRFAEMFGGYVELESELGVGSVFSLWLPKRGAERAAEASRSDSSGLAQLASGEALGTVLVVDDEPDSRSGLARLLEAEGYAVLTASSGPRALALAEAHRPDLITLDVLMPGMDGWAVLSRLKQRPDLADIPTVIVSLVPDSNMGYALGAADVLAKPVSRDQLVRLLDRFGPGAGPNHVLVVDDDPGARDLLCRAVLKEGWDVQEAANGIAALESIRERTPRLVILDLMMPEMDGFEVLEQLRASPAMRGLPVIVVTAKQLTGAERMQLSQRVGSIMQKGSYSRADLVEHLRSLVDRSIGARPARPESSAARSTQA